MQAGKAVYAMTATEFASHVPVVLAAGANFIGGCCGTSPEFIREISRQLHVK
jgi:5-methyltetrahydrofolate--homocysteine methyltransferase